MVVQAKQFGSLIALPEFQFVRDGLYLRIDAVRPRGFAVIDCVAMLRSEFGEPLYELGGRQGAQLNALRACLTPPWALGGMAEPE
jgi:hypothetical protein